MLAAINTDELYYFTIDEWLANNEHSYYALRTNDMLENDMFDRYYLAFASNEQKLIDLITCDIWEGCYIYDDDPDILINNPFPFYVIDVETKKVLKKIELSIQKHIEIKEVGR